MEDDARPLLEIEILNLHVRLSLIMCNVLTVVFGICGNALALIIVTRSSKTSLPTKMYLVSLCISDLLLTGFSTVTDLDEIMDCFHSWGFGAKACSIVPFVEFILIMANGLSLLSMGIQRYWSLHILLTSKKQNWVENASVLVSTVALAFVWIIPAVFSIPFLESYKLSVYNCTWYPEVNTSAAVIDPVHQHPGLSATNPKFDFEFEEDEEVFSIILCRELPPEFGFNSEPAYCHLRDGKQTEASMIGVCDATGPESAENLYHITMGVIYAFIMILFIAGFYFLHAARKAESKYSQLLPSTSLRNIELMHNIRMVLTSRRRGIRIIMFMLALYIVCKLPFWIFIVAGKSEFYVSRSSSMLGVYFALHWLGNFKATITAYVYAHCNNAFQSNDRSHYTGQRSKHTCSLPWRRHKASFFAMNDPI